MLTFYTLPNLNINTNNPIIVDKSEASFTNSGTLATSFSGPHINSGTFTNNGIIQTLDGQFSVSGNSLTGSGSIITGAVPAELLSSCPGFVAVDLPAFGKWKLIAFGLLFLAVCMIAIQLRP